MKKYISVIFLLVFFVKNLSSEENNLKKIISFFPIEYHLSDEEISEMEELDLVLSHYDNTRCLDFLSKSEHLKKIAIRSPHRTYNSALFPIIQTLPCLVSVEELKLKSTMQAGFYDFFSKADDYLFPSMPHLRATEMDLLLETFGASFPNLKSLDMGYAERITFEWFAHIYHYRVPSIGKIATLFKDLETLHYSGWINNSGEDIGCSNPEGIENLKKLRHLKLSGRFNEIIEISFLSIPTLESLDLSLFRGEKNLAYRGPLPLLTTLIDSQPATLNYQSFAPYLKKIDISSADLSNLALNDLGENQEIETLIMVNCVFSEENKEQSQWTTLPSLKHLNLKGSNARGLAFYTFAPNLCTLNLEDTKVGTNDIHSIAMMEHLEELFLANTPITQGAVKFLGKCLSLKKLGLQKTNLRGAAFDALIQIEYLYLSDCDFTVEDFKKFGALSRLKELHLYNLKNRNITNTLIKELENQLPQCKIFYL